MNHHNPDSDNHLEHLAGSGVEALIQRLREEGVAAGKSEAQRLLDDARREAEQIISDAQAEKETLIREARQEARQIREGGEEALRVAARDSLLQLKHQMLDLFSRQIHDKVSASLQETDLLRRLIIQIAAQTCEALEIDPAEPVEIRLSAPSLDRSLPSYSLDGDQDPLTRLALDGIRESLKPGINLSFSDDPLHGIHIILQDRGIKIDLSDEGVSNLLLNQLQPRFKAILDGLTTF
ncbi:MAG: hypothetical protein Kow0060_14180 [Methylohalobius crimeensis]